MTAEKESHEEPTIANAAKASDAEEVVSSMCLFGGRREIWIEHAGERYRLRISRRNKLILQK